LLAVLLLLYCCWRYCCCYFDAFHHTYVILAIRRLEVVGVVACRTVLMAVSYDGEELHRIRTFFEESWKVKHVVQLGGCIVCSPTKPVGQASVTRLGEVEYIRTGVCEACFDRHDGVQSSTYLTDTGAYLLMMWQVVAKASKGLRALPPHSKLLSRISERSYAWPAVYNGL